MELKDVTAYPVNVSTDEFNEEYLKRIKSGDDFDKLTKDMTNGLLEGLVSDEMIDNLVDEISGQDGQISISPLAVKLILQSLSSISDKIDLTDLVMSRVDDKTLTGIIDSFVTNYIDVKKDLLSMGKRVVEDGLGSERLSYFHTSAFRSKDQIGQKNPKSLPSVKIHAAIDTKFRDNTLKRVADPDDKFIESINAKGKVTQDDLDYIRGYASDEVTTDEEAN